MSFLVYENFIKDLIQQGYSRNQAKKFIETNHPNIHKAYLEKLADSHGARVIGGKTVVHGGIR
jgi:cell division ATPase FtsA